MMGNEVPERAATVLNGKIQMVCDDDAVERVSSRDGNKRWNAMIGVERCEGTVVGLWEAYGKEDGCCSRDMAMG